MAACCDRRKQSKFSGMHNSTCQHDAIDCSKCQHDVMDCSNRSFDMMDCGETQHHKWTIANADDCQKMQSIAASPEKYSEDSTSM